MPSYTRGKKRPNLVFVLINDFLYFGFKSKDLTTITGVSTSDISALGHIPEGSTFGGKIKIIGANAPTPPKVSKKIPNATVEQQKTVSTYCDYSSLDDAQVLGWNLIKTKQSVNLRSLNVNRSSLTAIAELGDGSFYCFPMNRDDFESYGADLGLQSATGITTESERKRLVSGCSIPYPGKASKLLAGKSTFSSFFATSKADDLLSLGYSIESEEIIIDPGTVPFFI